MLKKSARKKVQQQDYKNVENYAKYSGIDYTNKSVFHYPNQWIKSELFILE